MTSSTGTVGREARALALLSIAQLLAAPAGALRIPLGCASLSVAQLLAAPAGAFKIPLGRASVHALADEENATLQLVKHGRLAKKVNATSKLARGQDALRVLAEAAQGQAVADGLEGEANASLALPLGRLPARSAHAAAIQGQRHTTLAGFDAEADLDYGEDLAGGAVSAGDHASLAGSLPPIYYIHQLAGDKALKTVNSVALYVVMPVFAVLVLVLLFGSKMSLQRYTKVIPDSAWQVFIAALCGFVLRGLIHAGVITVRKYAWASVTLLNLFLLPVIIFQSGWAIEHLTFFSEMGYIVIFALLGTIVSFFSIGFAGYWLGQQGLFSVTGLRANLAFAALISATDPVATLCTFTRIGLDKSQPLLYTLLYGESVLNDAVAIVLFNTVNSNWDNLSVGSGLGYIAVLLFGSVAFGIVLASVLVWMLRMMRLPGNTVPETLYIVASAWLIFAAAEACKLSGIIANLCAGCIFRLYGAKHLDAKGLERTDEVLLVTAQLMECMIFILCGASTALINSPSGVRFAAYGFVLCLIGRALSTSSCAMLSNAIKVCMGEPKSKLISVRQQCSMWHAGLRGGIALLLSMELDASWCRQKATLINATLIIICTTLVLFGSTTEPFLRLLGLNSGMQDAGSVADEGCGSTDDTAGAAKEAGSTANFSLLRFLHYGFRFVLVGSRKKGEEQHPQKEAASKSP